MYLPIYIDLYDNGFFVGFAQKAINGTNIFYILSYFYLDDS